MKNLVLLVVASLTFCSAAAQRADMTMTVEGELRSFIVVRPLGSAPAGGYPVVFMLHGTSGDGEKFWSISGWKEVGARENFITVFPSSLEWQVKNDVGAGCHATTKWVNGDLSGAACEGQTFKNDILFIRRIVDTLKQLYSINARMVFATGFSNGGVMTSKMSTEMSDVFAAYAASAGPMHRLDSAQPAVVRPMWFTVGTLDDRFTTAMGVSELPFNDTALAYFSSILGRHLGAHRLTNEYTVQETPVTRTYRYSTPQVGAPPTMFSFTLVKGLFHQYPNGQNFPVSSAEVFWEFFKASAAATTVDDGVLPEVELRVYPNPASDVVRVERAQSSDATYVQIVNIVGEVVRTASIDGHSAIVDVKGLPQGAYIVRVGKQTRVMHIN